MLSNPQPSLQNKRHRQHRRQNSTPTAFDTPKVALLPTTQKRHGHRRGLSLDQRPQRQQQLQETVSTTNQGLQHEQQYILREAQQQRLAGPGQHVYTHYTPTYQQNFENTHHLKYGGELDHFVGLSRSQTLPQLGQTEVAITANSANSLQRSQSSLATTSMDIYLAGNSTQQISGQGLDTTSFSVPSSPAEFNLNSFGLDLEQNHQIESIKEKSATQAQVADNEQERRNKNLDLLQLQNADLRRPITPPNQSRSGKLAFC